MAGWQLHCSLLPKQLLTAEISDWTLGILQLSGCPGPYLAGSRELPKSYELCFQGRRDCFSSEKENQNSQHLEVSMMGVK